MGFNRFNGGFSRGNGRVHRIRSFDPSAIIKSTVVREVVIKEEYIPKNSFADFALDEKLKHNIISHGYLNPTPIQDQSIPELLNGRDVVGIANTGTGKTAAFLVPFINKVVVNRGQKVLIIAPTRELAVQIEQEFRLFARGLNLFSQLCIGGVSLTRQIIGLSRNPQFVIGTPGRLKDLENQGKLNFNSFANIILDEVDRMLDMGFINDITHIAARLPAVRQSAFFSATMTESVQKVMRQFIKDPVTVSVKSSDNLGNVVQEVVPVSGLPKVQVLHNLLVKPGFDKVLVFGRTKHGLEKLARELQDRGFRVAAIHGNKNQNQRQRSLEDFKHNHIKILLATDVASRGLDIDDVTHVINFDLPESYEDYIHRIGRTGRAGKTGVALTLV
ncbi:DEAD/DEAH box helicase [Candidatus Woesebacteria bacterium]|nr:DEAD/DEAH box helicase [Candidatus Woesebacteria bacterium]